MEEVSFDKQVACEECHRWLAMIEVACEKTVVAVCMVGIFCLRD